jgi:hypothetical protein
MEPWSHGAARLEKHISQAQSSEVCDGFQTIEVRDDFGLKCLSPRDYVIAANTVPY